MRTPRHFPKLPAGVSLVETVVAVAVLAVAIPLSMAAMSKAGGETSTARAETRAPAIAEYIKLELEQARRGISSIYGSLDENFMMSEESGGIPLAFGRDGRYLAPLSMAEYRDGVKPNPAKEEVFYVAMATSHDSERGKVITVRVGHPAVRSAVNRKVVSFHSLLP